MYFCSENQHNFSKREERIQSIPWDVKLIQTICGYKKLYLKIKTDNRRERTTKRGSKDKFEIEPNYREEKYQYSSLSKAILSS